MCPLKCIKMIPEHTSKTDMFVDKNNHLRQITPCLLKAQALYLTIQMINHSEHQSGFRKIGKWMNIIILLHSKS